MAAGKGDDGAILDVHSIGELQAMGIALSNDQPKYAYEASSCGKYSKSCLLEMSSEYHLHLMLPVRMPSTFPHTPLSQLLTLVLLLSLPFATTSTLWMRPQMVRTSGCCWTRPASMPSREARSVMKVSLPSVMMRSVPYALVTSNAQ